jgi:enamine deaminase RidA (YjgF/YER057c/UK114 family)
MPRQIINPNSLHESVKFGFSHVATSTGGTTIHCAGQVAWDVDENVIGVGDLATQTTKALDNVRLALAAAGATPADVVSMRTYVVDHSPDKLETICGAIGAFYGDTLPAPNVLIGVQTLALPDFLVEIEVTAVLA